MERLRWLLPGFLAALYFMSVPVASQTRQQLREQAESQLQRMTPEEIEQKLRDMGITREEAVQRASAYGISLEDFLATSSSGTLSVPREQAPVRESSPFSSDPRLMFSPSGTGRQPEGNIAPSAGTPLQRRRADVPGFVGRRGIDTLIQPFGYNIFLYPPSTYLSQGTVATPTSYAIGPGDEVQMALWGETRLSYHLTVNREGNVVVPDVGPVAANGLTLGQFREKLLRRMTAVYSSLRNGAANAATFLDVSLGRLRNVEVFVLGEVLRPGGYSIPSMSTVLTAMYMAGGPSVDGTMRQIRLVRNGDTVRTIDLYDYVLRGDRSGDRPLRDGDVVFVDPAGKRVAIVGYVVRPAIFELKPDENLGSLLELAGGPRFNAYINRIHVERIIPFAERAMFARDIQDFDVSFRSVAELQRSGAELESGDILTVLGIGDLVANRVTITGHVRKPGPFELKPGMTIRDLVLSADSLQLNTFAERASLYRVMPNLRREVHPFSLRLAMEGDGVHNVVLQNEDSVVVYNVREFFPLDSVYVAGSVRFPGAYLRHDSMTIADLVVAAGGLTEDASREQWELSRLDTNNLGIYSHVYKVNVSRDYWVARGTQAMPLYGHDVLLVPPDPKYNRQKTVTITGSVMFPGPYSLRFEGERLASLMRRAGGMRQGAYLAGSKLVRKFNNAGLVPVDFVEAFDDSSSRDNVVLYDGDSVHVAFFEDVVYVSGEVIVPSPVLYKKGADPEYYVEQAGGYKEEADEGRTVTMLPGGKKWESSGWFFIRDDEVLPGSSIYVPREVEKEDKTLPIIRDMATILASLAAITVALVQVTK